MSKFSEHAATFKKDKEELDPVFKPLANVSTNIARVRNIVATRAQNPAGDDYAVFKMTVDVEGEDGVATKEWNISSETLVDTLEEKGIDIGSSFTVLKTGEGFKTKYQITNVVNRAAPTAAPAPVEAPTEQAQADESVAA
jgi:hypothetical protein